MDQEKLSLLVGLLSPSLENMGRCFTMNNIINDASTMYMYFPNYTCACSF